VFKQWLNYKGET